MQPLLTDAAMVQSGSLPNGAVNTNTTVFDTLNGSFADTVQTMEWEIGAPALTTAELPDTQTMTYAAYISANANGSSPVLLYDKVLVQTGAGGAGAGAATARFRVPFQPGGKNAALRYMFVKATNTGAGNPSAKKFTLTPYF